MPPRLKLFSGAAIVVVLLFGAALRWRANAEWEHADFEARAVEFVGKELPAGARAGLVGKALPAPPHATDRFMCVTAHLAEANAAIAYEVQFRRGTFRTEVNEIYTPNWQPAHSGAIAQQDCLALAGP